MRNAKWHIIVAHAANKLIGKKDTVQLVENSEIRMERTIFDNYNDTDKMILHTYIYTTLYYTYVNAKATTVYRYLI